MPERLGQLKEHVNEDERIETLFELEQSAEKWEPNVRGVLVEVNGRILLNGNEVVYDGEYDDWFSHPDGVVIRKGRDFYLNGTELLYHDEGALKGYYGMDGNGVMIREGTALRPNGGDNIVPKRRENWKRFEPHPTKGAVLEYMHSLIVDGKVIYEGHWDNWYPHPDGVLVEKNGKMYLNGEDELCPVTVETIWYPHPEGIVVRIDDKLCLNGDPDKVWFDGNCDDVKWYGDQAFVKRGNTWLRVRAELSKAA